MRKKREAK